MALAASGEVRLFQTCLGEGIYPAVPEAARAVLSRQGLKVTCHSGAFCCGQAAFNEGLRSEALSLAEVFLEAFPPGRPIVVPSGSCASMLKVFYEDLLAERKDLLDRARALRPWIFEFSEYLIDVLKITDVGARFPRRVTYHPSCHLLRELHIDQAPRKLLRAVADLEFCELPGEGDCCGFGGLFSVKFPEISAAILRDKVANIQRSGAEAVVANDSGCLMQISGGLSRAGVKVETLHLAEVLARR